ncbi:MAG: GldG family protein [Clostridia bacterium]|nr:GldG family protein [Clostridia bacterium]
MRNFDETKKTPDDERDLPAEEAVQVVEKPKNSKKTIKLPKLNWRSNRKLRLGATATAITVVVAAVIVLINVICGVLADRFPWTLDLTADQTYSLSEESHAVADVVSAPIEIVVLAGEEYFSNPNMGAEEYDTIFRQFYLFTQEYETLSDGKITTTYVDLEKNPTLSSSYEEKYEATSGDILFLCGEQYRKISLDDLLQEDVDYTTYSYTVTSLVEQKLATNISSVCGGKTVTVTFLTGHGESESSIAALKSLYELNGYFTQTLDFTSAATISDTTGAIAIVGPTKDYTLDEIKRLRQWLDNDGKRGRHLFVFANYSGTCPNLYDFLSADYGITVTSNIIMETDANNYPMDFYGSYPYWPLTTVTSSDLTDSIANQKVIMPLTLQLLTDKSSDTEEEILTNHTLVSFPESSRLTALTDLLSAESNDDVVQVEADSYPIIGMAYARDLDVVNNQTVINYIVVSGSYQFADYATSSQYQNEGLVLEPLRTVCSLGDTVVISGKDLSADTFSVSTLTAQVIGLGVFTFGIPLVLVIICLIVFFKRRHL